MVVQTLPYCGWRPEDDLTRFPCFQALDQIIQPIDQMVQATAHEILEFWEKEKATSTAVPWSIYQIEVHFLLIHKIHSP